MKFSRIINYLLGLLGLKLVKLSSLQKLRKEVGSNLINDIQEDKEFIKLYDKIKEYTMVDIERCYALYNAVKYIIKNNIPGDFVECGVWKGGSAMLIAYTLLKAGVTDRKIILYDTFEGMTKPGGQDGEFEKEEWERNKISDTINRWCLADEKEAEMNMRSTAYPFENIKIVKGKAENTIPQFAPLQIALLRLDTDWYESTKHELTHLFPLIEKKGVLIIDDYGAWQGAKKAVDEYFAGSDYTYLHRIDWTGRMLIK
jgi:O-methyltransferase